jgi:hypothetical protein
LNSIFINQPSWPFEVLVVDNGSIDGSVEMTSQRFPDVRLIENRENLGFAKANNQAIRLCRGRFILLLNSDALLLANTVQKMIDVMISDSSIGIAGAQLICPDGRSQVSHRPLPNYWTEVYSLFGLDKLFKPKQNQQEYEETGAVSGACMLIRKTLLDQIGLLDEAFFMFNEEVDLCNRCHNAGLKVVSVYSATAIHAEGGSTGQTVQRVVRLYSGKLHYFYKYFGPSAEQRLKRVMWFSAMVKSIIYRMIRVISFGRIRKDDFWWAVSKELSTIFQ